MQTVAGRDTGDRATYESVACYPHVTSLPRPAQLTPLRPVSPTAHSC